RDLHSFPTRRSSDLLPDPIPCLGIRFDRLETRLPGLQDLISSLGIHNGPLETRFPSLPDAISSLGNHSGSLETRFPSLPDAISSLGTHSGPLETRLPSLPDAISSLGIHSGPLETRLPSFTGRDLVPRSPLRSARNAVRFPSGPRRRLRVWPESLETCVFDRSSARSNARCRRSTRRSGAQTDPSRDADYRVARSRMGSSRGASGSPRTRSIARVEDDRVDDRDHAAFGLREREVSEAANDALHHALVRQVAPAVGCHRHRTASVDDELHGDATLQVRVRSHSVLVAEPETTEVLTNDALDDLRRQTTVDLRRAFAKLRRFD